MARVQFNFDVDGVSHKLQLEDGVIAGPWPAVGGEPTFRGQPQLVDATKRLNTSDGFIHPKVCRGRLLSYRATAFSSARV